MIALEDLPFITEDEDILSCSISYTPSLGRIAVHLTLSEGYGEISRQIVGIIRDEEQSSAFNDCLRVLFNEIPMRQLL